MDAFDLVIHGGDIVSWESGGDSSAVSGELLRGYNVGVIGDRIETITPRGIDGRIDIDASGLIVSPGFIDFHSQVDGKQYSAERIALQGGTTTIGGKRNFDGSVVRSIVERGFILNHGFHISHSFTLRRAVGINDPYRAATEDEVQQMSTLAQQFFESGILGIHFGLEFVPGVSEAEIIRLTELAGKYCRPAVFHMRKDGKNALTSFDEIANVAKQTNASLHVLHLMYMGGQKEIAGNLIRRIREARAQGLDITGDSGVYDAFPTCIGSSILDGNWKEKYRDGTTISDVTVSSGIYAGQICDDKSFRYLREEFPNTLVTVAVLDGSEIVGYLKEPYIYVSTNAVDGPHYENVGHPETAGTFPRLLGRYVREEQAIDLLTALSKITCLPARRFNLKGRGELCEGFFADITVFDAERIIDRADFVGKGNPNAAPDGIAHVIVNGEPIVNYGRLTAHSNPGRMLRYDE